MLIHFYQTNQMQNIKNVLKRIRNIARRILNWPAALFVAAKTSFVKTDKRRWEKVSKEVPPWDDRNQAIAAFIPEGVSVLDLGCGAQTMKRHLKPGCKYQPCDIVQSSPNVIHCDFNSGVYPALTTKYDYVICSGIFEYMRDPATFISEIRNYGKTIIFTYNLSNSKQLVVERLGKGWVNHLEEAKLEQLFAANEPCFPSSSPKGYRLCLFPELIFELTPPIL